MQNTSSKQQTKQKYKPNHQHTGLLPPSALPIRGKTNKKLSTNLTLCKAYTSHWTNLRRAETKRKKEFNLLQGKKSIFLEACEKKTLKKRQRNTAQIKEETRNTEVQINEEEIGKLPGKEFRIMIVKTIKNLENKMEKMQESINKDLEELKNKHTETNNTITEIKNTLEGLNSRISEAEERISELEDKMVEITSEEQNKVKRMKRAEDSLRDLWDHIRYTNI